MAEKGFRSSSSQLSEASAAKDSAISNRPCRQKMNTAFQDRISGKVSCLIWCGASVSLTHHHRMIVLTSYGLHQPKCNKAKSWSRAGWQGSSLSLMRHVGLLATCPSFE